MKPVKNFHRDGLAYSRLRQSEGLAAYVISIGSKILHYQIMKIENGELVFGEDHEIYSLSVLKSQWERLLKKVSTN